MTCPMTYGYCQDMARGNVRSKGGDRWEIRVYAGAGKYISRSIRGSRREADTALARLITEMADGKAARPSAATVTAFLEEWFHTASVDWSPGTAMQARTVIDAYLIPRIGSELLHRLSTHRIDQLYASLRREGVRGHPLAASTVRRIHGYLHQALEQAVIWGRIPTNPAARARRPKIQKIEREMPTVADLGRLLAAADNDELRVFLRLEAATGARRGEVCALRWADLDLDSAVMHIRSRAVLSADGVLILPMTKSGTARRVALDSQTVTILRRHQLAMTERTFACGSKLRRDAFVFSDGPACQSPWRPDSTSRRFRVARDAAGLGSLRLHDLRHAHATALIGAGIDVATVAERLGHSRKSTTLDIYVHRVDGADERAAKIAGDLLG